MGRIVSFKDRSLFLKRPIVRQSFPFSFVFLLYEIFDSRFVRSPVIRRREDFTFLVSSLKMTRTS